MKQHWKHAVNEIKISDVIEDENMGNKTSKIYNMDHAVCGLATCDVAKKFMSAIGSFPTLNSIRLLSGPIAISIKVRDNINREPTHCLWRGEVWPLQPGKFFSKGQAAVSFTSGTTYQARTADQRYDWNVYLLLKLQIHLSPN
ncbi:hypothetical protein Tco_1089133 [Tanacetum coccineum]